MIRRSRWLWGIGMTLWAIGLLVGPGRAQGDHAAPPTAPSETEPRTIFVPFWQDSLEGRAAGGTGGRAVTADVLWTDVPLGVQEKEPARAPRSASVLLLEFRLSTGQRRPGEPRRFVALIRVQPFRPGAAPLLEVLDQETAIQSQAWGRLLRRVGDAADFVFVAREPLPPTPTPLNPALRGRLKAGDADRRFNLQLSLDASPPRNASPRRVRRRPR